MSSISVVIPTLNRPAGLRDRLREVALADPAPTEVVVVVQGRGLGMATSLVEEVGLVVPLRVVESRLPLGSGRARNVGVAVAGSDVVHFLDDDVAMVQTDLYRRLEAWFDHSWVCAVDGAYTERNSTPRSALRGADIAGILTETPPTEARLSTTIGLCGGNFAIRRADFLAAGGFDERLGRAEDRELGIRLWKAGAVVLHDEALALPHQRANEGGMRQVAREGALDPRDFLFVVEHFGWATAAIRAKSMLARSWRHGGVKGFVRRLLRILSALGPLRSLTRTGPQLREDWELLDLPGVDRESTGGP